MKLEFIKASEKKGRTNPRVKGMAYSGGKINVGWGYPVVVDIEGMEFAPQVAFLADHKNNVMSRIGLIIAQKKDSSIYIVGEITSNTYVAQEVIAQAKAGADWQLSIGAAPKERGIEFIDSETSRTVNGQEHSGPFYHVKKSVLREVSALPVGADANTTMTVEASFNMEGIVMPKAKKIEGAANPSEANPGNIPENTINAEAEAGGANGEGSEPSIQAAVQPATPPQITEVQAQALAANAVTAERQRVATIQDICAGEFPEIQAEAIREGWGEDQVNAKVLAALRENRPAAPNAIIAGASTAGVDSFLMLEASALLTGGMSIDDVVKATSDKAVEAAQRKYRSGVGLQQLLLEAAWHGGYTGISIRGHEREVLQAAFSSNSLPGLLSNVANKFLLSSFNAVEQVWRKIAAIRSVSDFKRITSYRLTGNMEFDEIGPDGELKHGSLGEESYGNQAKTHGKIFAITRQQIINDDLGALTAVPKMIGRGGALKVNKVFWTEFMANSAYCTADNKNLLTGAGSALSIAALSAARKQFATQVDSAKNPLAMQAKYILVPIELEDLAGQLYNDTKITGAQSEKTESNPNKGKCEPISSAYLSNEIMSNHSSTAWYLLANPEDIPFIEVAFLNGNQNPIVESAAADFDTLGIKMRGYFDFGVEKQDYRAIQKNTGA